MYLAEFQTRRKTKTESWPEFGEDLLALVDKAYPSLDDEARQQLALQKYLSQLDNEQVSFSVKQGKPKTVEAAVSATLECESYLVRPLVNCGAVTPVQVESKDGNRTLMDMMMQLMARMDKLEEKSLPQSPVRRDSVGRRPVDQDAAQGQRIVVCYRCGQEGHFARGCARSKKSSNQGN